MKEVTQPDVTLAARSKHVLLDNRNLSPLSLLDSTNTRWSVDPSEGVVNIWVSTVGLESSLAEAFTPDQIHTNEMERQSSLDRSNLANAQGSC